MVGEPPRRQQVQKTTQQPQQVGVTITMIVKDSKSDPSDKDIVKMRFAAAGDLPNEKVANCYTCKKQGYLHEAITIEKVKGRPLSDGTTEVLGYKIKDYFTDRPHKHKQQPQQPQQEGRYYMGWDLEVFD